MEPGPYRTPLTLVPPAPPAPPPRPRSWWARWRCHLGRHREAVDTGQWVNWGTHLLGGPLYECACGKLFQRRGAVLFAVPSRDPTGRWARWRCRLGWHREAVDTGQWVSWGTHLLGGPLYECACGKLFQRRGAVLFAVPHGPPDRCMNVNCGHSQSKHRPDCWVEFCRCLEHRADPKRVMITARAPEPRP